MTTPHQHINLEEVDDVAPARGWDDRFEARFCADALGAEATGLSHFGLRPGKRSPFVHRHQETEEVYVIIGGSGRMKLDDQITDVRPLDAIRVQPDWTG